ncbi:GNAT family N-acetyltransferase [Paenibacillus sp. NPDC058071]|uniref:GNAT family N-acetyltransferase n=1 Tax=Paenibacillus sp. NPDC058071 TaxID=3346326 RepID=UPI0036DCDE55
MELQLLAPDQWIKERNRLLGFAVKYGEQRLTAAGLRALHGLAPSSLAANGDAEDAAAIAVAKESGRLVGLAFAAGGGEGDCLAVVHPGMRGRGVGKAMMEALVAKFGKLVCHVATDNAPSLALCFSLGLSAVSMHTGPTGKPTLRFERRVGDGIAGTRHFDVVHE